MAIGFIKPARNSALTWLLAVTVGGALLLWLASLACRMTHASDSWISAWLAVPASPVLLLQKPWTALTYMIAHLSPLHLIFNTLWLYWFGIMLADVARDRSIIVLFAGGGVAGAVAYAITAWLTGYPPTAFLTGDSAAVLSVMTATAWLMPNRELRLFLLGDVKVKWIAIACIAITLLGAGSSGLPTQVAHLSGIIFATIWSLSHKGVLALPKAKTVSAQGRYRRINTRATINAMRRATPMNDKAPAVEKTPEQRLDVLLDKIRVSGYDSLSEREKRELNLLSNQL